MDNSETIPRKEHYSQVCIWPGVTLGDDSESEGMRVQLFQDHMTHIFDDVRVQFLEELELGEVAVIIFAIHNEDIGKFVVPRLEYGIRWVEDATDAGNSGGVDYPVRIREYRSW